MHFFSPYKRGCYNTPYYTYTYTASHTGTRIVYGSHDWTGTGRSYDAIPGDSGPTSHTYEIICVDCGTTAWRTGASGYPADGSCPRGTESYTYYTTERGYAFSVPGNATSSSIYDYRCGCGYSQGDMVNIVIVP